MLTVDDEGAIVSGPRTKGDSMRRQKRPRGAVIKLTRGTVYHPGMSAKPRTVVRATWQNTVTLVNIGKAELVEKIFGDFEPGPVDWMPTPPDQGKTAKLAALLNGNVGEVTEKLAAAELDADELEKLRNLEQEGRRTPRKRVLETIDELDEYLAGHDVHPDREGGGEEDEDGDPAGARPDDHSD